MRTRDRFIVSGLVAAGIIGSLTVYQMNQTSEDPSANFVIVAENAVEPPAVEPETVPAEETETVVTETTDDSLDLALSEVDEVTEEPEVDETETESAVEADIQ